jgi:hypothetical protein
MLNVMLWTIGPFANVLQNGQEILIFNVIRVSFSIHFLCQTQTHNQCVFAVECQHNNECPPDKACVAEECSNPCIGTQCGENALCHVDYHIAKCTCSKGLQGNPYVTCIPVGCRKDNDCSQTESCDRHYQVCSPLCTVKVCASGASCTPKDHKEICICNDPLRGDGYVYCQKRKIPC